jgi:hypothetical protein
LQPHGFSIQGQWQAGSEQVKDAEPTLTIVVDDVLLTPFKVAKNQGMVALRAGRVRQESDDLEGCGARSREAVSELPEAVSPGIFLSCEGFYRGL